MSPFLIQPFRSSFNWLFKIFPILDHIACAHDQLNHYCLELFETDQSVSIFIYIVYYLLPIRLWSFDLRDRPQYLMQLISRYKPGLIDVKHAESLLEAFLSQQFFFVSCGKGPFGVVNLTTAININLLPDQVHLFFNFLLRHVAVGFIKSYIALVQLVFSDLTVSVKVKGLEDFLQVF